MDREKVIKGLETCYCPPAKCEDCPYHDLPDEQSCNDALCLDTLHLLKEQDELLHKKQKDVDRLCNEISEWKHKFHDRPLNEQEPLAVCEGKVNKCVCGNEINRYWHPEYCGSCGKKLEWY